MPSKRNLLEQLNRNELLALIEQTGVEVQDRRVRDQLVDALARSRKLDIAAVLADYSRDRLKELCAAR